MKPDRQSMETVFKSNPNKDFLRSGYDKAIVKEWFSEAGRPLEYLGLPGPDMLDIVEWQEFLGRFTAIERGENEQHLLFLRANVRDVEHRLYSLYGEFDEIIRTGRDRYNRAPRWPYDLVNLDYYGGLVYQTLSRPLALQKLIANQDEYKRSFLLVITQHLRDADLKGEKLSFFDELERRLVRDLGSRGTIAEAMTSFKSTRTPDTARQVAYVNILLRDFGEASHFQVNCRPAIVYSGTGGARMLHFVTALIHSERAYRAVSEQSLIDVVNLGYRELRDAQLFDVTTVPKIH